MSLSQVVVAPCEQARVRCRDVFHLVPIEGLKLCSMQHVCAVFAQPVGHHVSFMSFFDATSQESLLETETARLLKAKSHASKTRENLEELLKAYHIDSRLEAERCAKS